MATLTVDTYRQSLFGPDDDLFRRCLAGSTILGLLFVIAMLIAPARRIAITHVEQLSPRFAKLILEPPKPKPAPLPVAAPGPVGPPPGGTPGLPPGAASSARACRASARARSGSRWAARSARASAKATSGW